jgi:hypothetical protein
MTGRRSKRHRLYVDALRRNGTYEQLVEAHGSETCWGCGREPGKRKLAIDHDHRGMFPRGLLCWRCNRLLETSVTPELLRALADYLEAANGRWEAMIRSKATGA